MIGLSNSCPNQYNSSPMLTRLVMLDLASHTSDAWTPSTSTLRFLSLDHHSPPMVNFSRLEQAAMGDQAPSPEPVEEAYFDSNKISLLTGAEVDAVTFSIQEEDHTLGNALRYIIMRNPDVEFCGYSAPHPSEPKIHLRIQMFDGKSASQALLKGLDDLDDLFRTIEERYQNELTLEKFERFIEPTNAERLEKLKREKYPHLLNEQAEGMEAEV